MIMQSPSPPPPLLPPPLAAAATPARRPTKRRLATPALETPPRKRSARLVEHGGCRSLPSPAATHAAPPSPSAAAASSSSALLGVRGVSNVECHNCERLRARLVLCGSTVRTYQAAATPTASRTATSISLPASAIVRACAALAPAAAISSTTTTSNSDDTEPVYDSVFVIAPCRNCYCERCLESNYLEPFDKILRQTRWMCPSCRDICSCHRCVQDRARRLGMSDEQLIGPMTERTGVYYAERVLASAALGHTMYYLLKWDGYPLAASTWEHRDNVLSATLLDDFHASQARIAISAEVLAHRAKRSQRRRCRRHRRSKASASPGARLSHSTGELELERATSSHGAGDASLRASCSGVIATHNKRQPQLRRTTDYDIDRVVSWGYGAPSSIPERRVVDINIPSFRELYHADASSTTVLPFDDASSSTSSSDEDTSDEAFARRHRVHEGFEFFKHEGAARRRCAKPIVAMPLASLLDDSDSATEVESDTDAAWSRAVLRDTAVS